MEKDFETFDFLIKYDDGVVENVDPGQEILIVDQNGCMLNGNKPIAYVEEVENTKGLESLQCPMYNVVNQQPMFFQLHNSCELIPISVNPIQPEEPSNVFVNNYSLPNSNDGQVASENDIVKHHNEKPNQTQESQSMDIDPNEITSAYEAAITITEEQYKIFKRIGWTLIEFQDDVFLLDKSGLHNITNDHVLMKQQTSLIRKSYSQPSRCSIKVLEKSENETVLNQESCAQPEAMEIIIASETEKQKGEVTISQNDNHKFTARASEKSIKIHLKTQHLLKGIPKKIVLGKTINGKKLIARMVEGKSTSKKNKDILTKVGKDRNINEKQFAKLVQQVLLGTAENCRMEDISSVESFMSQMLRVPEMRSKLDKHKLIITRTLREVNEDGLIEKQSEPIVVTGRFVIDGNEGEFVHIPDMLQQHMNNSESDEYGQNNENQAEAVNPSGDMFLHINITVTNDANNRSWTSGTLNKRCISLKQVYNMKKKLIRSVYACNACAKVFESQEDFEVHQECSEVPDHDKAQLLTMDKDKNVKLLICNECEVTFDNVKKFQKHLRVHNEKPTDPEAMSSAKCLESSDKKQTEVFKCKMCSNTYLHSSSLSKHVVTKHILATHKDPKVDAS